MLLDSTWSEAGLEEDMECHLKCVESRLGRQLLLKDFTLAPTNDVIRFGARSRNNRNIG